MLIQLTKIQITKNHFIVCQIVIFLFLNIKQKKTNWTFMTE